MRRGAISLLAIPLIIFDGWGGKAPPRGAEEAAVRAVVEAYFDGLMQGSPDRLRAVAGGACLIRVGEDGEYVRVPFARWAADMTRARENPRAYRNEIAAVDVAGNAAMVKTVLRWPGVTYVDYLSLLRDGRGEWRIVHKVGGATAR